MSRRKGRKQTTSQTILLVLSLIVASSMILSLFLAYLPGPQEPTPTPWPTWTPIPRPTATAMPTPWPTEPLPTATALPTGEATAPPIGPVLPTPSATPGIGATPTTTSTLPPTVQPTAPPIGPVLPTPSATPGTEVTPTVSATPPAPAAGAQATPAATGFTFAVCGDSRGGADLYRRALAAIVADGSRFLIHTGDLVNKGTEEQWQEFTQIMADFPLPFYPVPGNHDALDGRLDGYLRYSGAPAAHYSFDYGPVHFTLADSHNGGLTAAELAWLRDDLSATARPVKMVFLHHPPFDPDGTDHIMAFGNEQFMALMAEMQVDYVFAGHIHAYARAEREGVVYLYTGGAGAPLYTAGHPQAFHHYLRVTVQGEEVAIEVVKI